MGEDSHDGSKDRFWYNFDCFSVNELTEVAQPITKVYLPCHGRVDVLQEIDAHENVAMSIVDTLQV